MRPLQPSILLAACLAAACATAPQGSNTIVVYLQHTKAEQMADTVKQFLTDGRANATNYPTVRADAASNSLLLEGEPENMQKVFTLIRNLDVERPK